MGYKSILVIGLISISVGYLNLMDKGEEVSSTFQFPQDKSMKNLTAFVLGGTGEVGKAIIAALANAPQFTRVTLIGRRQVTLPSPNEDKRYDKFDEKIIDFDELPQYSEAFKGYDVGYSTLGTTRAKVGAELFYKVDHDYVVQTAQLAKDGGCTSFHLVSSAGANKNSYFLYPKTKGEVEEEVTLMGFDKLSIYRPGLLLVPGKREDFRIGEVFFRVLMKPLEVLKITWFSVDVPLLGNVIVGNSLREREVKVEILDNGMINKMGKEFVSNGIGGSSSAKNT